MGSHALASSKGVSTGKQDQAASRRAFFCLLQQLLIATVAFWVLFGFFKGELSITGQNIRTLALCLWLQHVRSDLVLLSKKNSGALFSDMD